MSDKEGEEFVRNDFSYLFGGPPKSDEQIGVYIQRAISNGVVGSELKWLHLFLRHWMAEAAIDRQVKESNKPKRNTSRKKT